MAVQSGIRAGAAPVAIRAGQPMAAKPLSEQDLLKK